MNRVLFVVSYLISPLVLVSILFGLVLAAGVGMAVRVADGSMRTALAATAYTASLALIVSVTLVGSFAQPDAGGRSRLRECLAQVDEVTVTGAVGRSGTEYLLNVVLFALPAVAAVLLRGWPRALALLTLLAASPLVEATQAWVGTRICSVWDVTANWLGVGAGVVVGALVLPFVARRRSARRERSAAGPV